MIRYPVLLAASLLTSLSLTATYVHAATVPGNIAAAIADTNRPRLCENAEVGSQRSKIVSTQVVARRTWTDLRWERFRLDRSGFSAQLVEAGEPRCYTA